MNLRWPPMLPIKGRNKGLHNWLNRLMEAAKSAQVQVPHGMKRIVGPQGTLLEGEFGAAPEEDVVPTHFYFVARWNFPTGLTMAALANTVDEADRPAVETPVLINCTVADSSEFTTAHDDAYESSAPYISPWPGRSHVITLPYPITDGWVLDLGFQQILNNPSDGGITGAFFDTYAFDVTMANDPETGRTTATDNIPPRRWGTYTSIAGSNPSAMPSQEFRWVRYYPTPGINPTKTFIGLSVPQIVPDQTALDASFPSNIWVQVIGHAVDLSGLGYGPAFWGTDTFDPETHWPYV